MIERLELINFQSHKHSVLEFGKFTVLTGGSNSGKSAVLRALAGVLRNDSVNDYVTHGEKELTVVVHMDSGDVVTWNKGSGKNNYFVKYADGKTEEFHKVGSDVPEEVAQVLGAGPITMEGGGRLHINLHEQLESPFLVSKEYTPGFAAKIFGEITSAAKLQAAVAEGNKMLRSDNATLKTRKKDLGEYQHRVEDFSMLGLAEESLKQAKDKWKQAEALEKSIEELSKQIEFVKKAGPAIEEKEKLVERLRPAAKTSLEDLSRSSESLGRVEKKVRSLVEVDNKVSGLRKWLPALEKASGITSFARIVEIEQSLPQLDRAIFWCRDTDAGIDSNRILEKRAQERIAKTKEDLWEIYENLEVCPTCSAPLENGITHLKEDLV
ncbi:MAG: AAA family ATPase [Candidatus Bathyarchaeota archaeon]|nr:AAA family ATPase [Candidatus Bathyarchaeota archaeon]